MCERQPRDPAHYATLQAYLTSLHISFIISPGCDVFM